jgi:hypothetical protein
MIIRLPEQCVVCACAELPYAASWQTQRGSNTKRLLGTDEFVTQIVRHFLVGDLALVHIQSTAQMHISMQRLQAVISQA